MAEGILRHRINEAGLRAIVDSAGVSDYHTGEQPDKRAINTLLKRKIDISGLSARPFSVNDFDEFDVIYVMDSSNLMAVLAKARNDNDKSKVKMLMDEVSPNDNISIPDPYYGENDGFERVLEMIDAAAQSIVKKLS
jgi:protein-tyrosine phosphatase